MGRPRKAAAPPPKGEREAGRRTKKEAEPSSPLLLSAQKSQSRVPIPPQLAPPNGRGRDNDDDEKERIRCCCCCCCCDCQDRERERGGDLLEFSARRWKQWRRDSQKAKPNNYCHYLTSTVSPFLVSREPSAPPPPPLN